VEVPPLRWFPPVAVTSDDTAAGAATDDA